MTEKKPLAGEWWQKVNTIRGVEKPRVYVLGTSPDGKTVGMRHWLPGELHDGDSDFVYGTLDGIEGMQHLPDCTGWDWKPPEVLDARQVLEKIALSLGVDPLGVDSPDLAEMIVLANKKREQHNCREDKPEFTGREMDLLEAIANLRDNMDRLGKRVEKLEQAGFSNRVFVGGLW